MAANMQKIKLLKLYELLRKVTDESHPISRIELCRRLNEIGISSNVRTLSLDIEVLKENGFEVMSYLKDKEKFFYVPEHELTVPEIKILIDAVQAAGFITEKKTAELVEKVAAIGGSHQAELLKKNMVCFNTRKHTNEAIFYTVDSIEDAIIRRKKIKFNYFHLDECAERVYVTTGNGSKKQYCVEPVALMAFATSGGVKTSSLDRLAMQDSTSGLYIVLYKFSAIFLQPPIICDRIFFDRSGYHFIRRRVHFPIIASCRIIEQRKNSLNSYLCCHSHAKERQA